MKFLRIGHPCAKIWPLTITWHDLVQISQKSYCDYHMPQIGIVLSHVEIWHCLAVKKDEFQVDNARSYGFHDHMPRFGTRVVKVEFWLDNATSYPPTAKRWLLTCQRSVSFQDTRRNRQGLGTLVPKFGLWQSHDTIRCKYHKRRIPTITCHKSGWGYCMPRFGIAVP